MKPLFITLFALPMCFFYMYAESNCQKSSWIDSAYSLDASLLALKEIEADSSHEYSDSIIIPESLVNKYAGLLSAIWLLGTQASDDVFNAHAIRVQLAEVAYNALSMQVDTSLAWVQEFLQDSLLSGHLQFDSLTALYDMSLQYIYNENRIVLKSSKVLHLIPLQDAFLSIEGLSLIMPYSDIIGDGDDIRVDHYSDSTLVTFSKGWEGCLAGCVFRHYWKFAVVDCQAVFIEQYGDLTSVQQHQGKKSIAIFPNPASDQLSIAMDCLEHKPVVSLYNTLGVLVFQQQAPGGTESFTVDVSSFPVGVYVLQVQCGDGRYVEQVVVTREL